MFSFILENSNLLVTKWDFLVTVFLKYLINELYSYRENVYVSEPLQHKQADFLLTYKSNSLKLSHLSLRKHYHE